MLALWFVQSFKVTLAIIYTMSQVQPSIQLDVRSLKGLYALFEYLAVTVYIKTVSFLLDLN